MSRSSFFVWAFALSGCGVSTAEPTLEFDTVADQRVLSEQGREVRLFERAGIMVRGQNSVRIEPGGPALQVVPWMPAMGHGSAVEPLVEGDGETFVVSRLVLNMPGTWELRCTIGVDDHATLTVEVP